mmetsp:Transcript_5064/g.20155  ORF Transcript_5064/g.20155 Transcript_5064/m.20155 type:complete len:243 (-) Transcript_5064:51-779(-)
MSSKTSATSGRPASARRAGADAPSGAAASMAGSSTRAGRAGRTLAESLTAYRSMSGQADVSPEKLGRLMRMRGPAARPVLLGGTLWNVATSGRRCWCTSTSAGSAPPWPLLRSYARPRSRRHGASRRCAVPRAGLSLTVTDTGSLVHARRENAAWRDGRPTCATPCARASSWHTCTRLAHAQLVGGSHTTPPSVTSSCIGPTGDSSYSARKKPPRHQPNASTSRSSSGTAARASAARSSCSW